ncbi:AI-2E family transporter [Bradyrhizobium genomosp. I (2014)]|uniref:AI-2E family transporter n=1 Tax=Bradyrhizobium genomosp. I (2014) TaxID=2683269 RepID=UPI0012F8FBD3|nr:AI-2E family transporter [Bradyrhizobium sp. CCBAU 43298]
MALAILALYELQLVLLPFVCAAVVSYICWPVIGSAAAATRLPRALVATAAFLVIVGFGALFGWVGVPPFAREVAIVLGNLQGTIEHVVRGAVGAESVTVLGQQMSAQDLARQATAALWDVLSTPRLIAVLAGTTLGAGFGLMLTLVLLFFFMVSGDVIVHGLLRLVPPGHRKLVTDHLLITLDPVLRRYFVGVIAVVCLAAVLAYVGLGLALGVPHAIFLALLTGLLEAIPVVGPIAAATIAGLVALQHDSSLGAILAYGVYLAALRLVIDQLMGPILLGAAGRVHPTLIIFCFLAGGALFGIVGVITAVPIALVIRTTLATLYDEAPEQTRRKRNYAQETR